MENMDPTSQALADHSAGVAETRAETLGAPAHRGDVTEELAPDFGELLDRLVAKDAEVASDMANLLPGPPYEGRRGQGLGFRVARAELLTDPQVPAWVEVGGTRRSQGPTSWPSTTRWTATAAARCCGGRACTPR